jgi:hypothetical protein
MLIQGQQVGSMQLNKRSEFSFLSFLRALYKLQRITNGKCKYYRF